MMGDAASRAEPVAAQPATFHADTDNCPGARSRRGVGYRLVPDGGMFPFDRAGPRWTGPDVS